MSAWIEWVGGARAGTVHRLSSEPVMMGRSAGAQVRLDPHEDLAVSGRHALLVPSSEGWLLRDLGSTNGTWVNGERPDADHVLVDGDRVQLGLAGPLFVFRTDGPGTARVPPSGLSVETDGSARPVPWVTLAVAGVLIFAGLAYLAGRSATQREWLAERSLLEERMDSVLSVAQARTVEMRAKSDSLAESRTSDVQSLQLRISGLLEALQQSESEVRALRGSLQAAEKGDLGDGEVERLRQRLQTVSVALDRQQLAASLDFDTIERATRPAVAQIYVETPAGVVTGTAFGVSPSGLLMTNRHVVQGPDGTPASGRIGVQFSDSEQVWPAHIVAVSVNSDLALVQAERIDGTIPTVRGFNARADTLNSGSPVAIVGFPLGGRPPDGGAGVVRPLLTAGVTRATRDGLLEIQGYGDRGASGSPVVDRDGQVVGVLVGGRQNTAEHLLLAVPVAEALKLLDGR